MVTQQEIISSTGRFSHKGLCQSECLNTNKQYAGGRGLKNGIAVHVQQSQHAINWEEAKVEKVVPKYWQGRMWEPILICNQPQSMNLAYGLHLSSV